MRPTRAASSATAGVAAVAITLTVLAVACARPAGSPTVAGPTSSTPAISTPVTSNPATSSPATSNPATSDPATSDPVTPTPPAAPRLEVALHQPRYLQGEPRLAVAVTNVGEHTVTVTSARLRADHVAPVAAEAKHSVITPGSRVDLQVDVGEFRACDHPGPLDVEVELGLVSSTELVTLPLDPTLLDRLHDAECAQRALAEAVEIAFGTGAGESGPRRAGDRVHAALIVSRRAGEQPVRVESVRGSVVFVMLADGVPLEEAPRPLRTIGATEHAVAIPVEFSVSRCDPHVIGQAQQPLDFRAWLTSGDDDTVMVQLDPPDELVELLDELVDDCEPSRPN